MQAGNMPFLRTEQTRPVYFNGREIEMKYSSGVHDFRIGPWNVFAHILHEKPRDPHPNLYIVAPGTQYKSDAAGQFDHNEIISVLPLSSEPVEWDVYYAIVLDPTLKEDFRSERQLILATQNEFLPGQDLQFEEMPGAAFLRRYLHVDSVEGLDSYRRHDGKLPRLLIVPAKLCVKAVAIDTGAEAKEAGKTEAGGSASLAK
jgi:hypothetical protein